MVPNLHRKKKICVILSCSAKMLHQCSSTSTIAGRGWESEPKFFFFFPFSSLNLYNNHEKEENISRCMYN